MIISILKYSGFIALTALVVLLFTTTKNYYQLLLAVSLYIPFAYFALHLFPRRKVIEEYDSEIPDIASGEKTSTMLEPDHDKIDINDINKRAFLKLIGAAGLSYFIFSLIGRRSDMFIPGGSQKSDASEATTIGDTSGKKIDPAERQPMDGYRICEINDDVISFYGYTNKDGAWIIMREDTENNSFRYIRGEAGFRENWDRRESLVYDYYHNVF